MKQKLKKLAKKEMKKRNLTSKKELIKGDEIIETFRSSNELPYLPKSFSDLKTKLRQNAAQAFYFVHGKQINERTNAHIREVLQKKEGTRVIMGGIVSGYSEKGLMLLIEFPRTLHVVGNNKTDIELIDSHLWLKLKECTVAAKNKSHTVSLGDFLVIEGEAAPYISKGEKRYSLVKWAILESGLLGSEEGETVSIIEDYLRIGWIFKFLILDYEAGQGEMQVQDIEQIRKDEQTLIEIFKDKLSFQIKKHL